jgi:hypothetical protein
MSVACRPGILVVLVLATSAAHADPPEQCKTDEEIENCLDGCEGLPEHDQVVRYEPVGTLTLHVVARSGQSYLVFPQARVRGCKVYPIGRPAAPVARVEGRFGSASKVVAFLPPPGCAGDCPVALVAYGKASQLRAAVPIENACDYNLTLRPIRLFPGRDSIELLCRTRAAGGWEETRVLLDITNDALVMLYSLHTGGYAAVSPNERKEGYRCPSLPVGTLRVEKIGEKPLLRVVDPATGQLQSGKGALPARQLGYDPAQHSFVPTGAPDIPTRVDAFGGCSRR